MKTSQNYIIINFLIISLTSTFAIFILLFEISDPNFPEWITVLSLFFFGLSLFSFIRNFKNLKIGENEIQLKRLFRRDLVLSFTEIEQIEETDFRYRGESFSSNIYKGHYLTIKTESKKVRTTSLNEPDYENLRESLKKELGQKVKLTEKYHRDRLNWFLLATMTIPTIYLWTQIIEKMK
mgnify:CR=1 FL=1